MHDDDDDDFDRFQFLLYASELTPILPQQYLTGPGPLLPSPMDMTPTKSPHVKKSREREVCTRGRVLLHTSVDPFACVVLCCVVLCFVSCCAVFCVLY